jgi:ATP/maltotriose-dependent transcriptional regulator MalT
LKRLSAQLVDRPETKDVSKLVDMVFTSGRDRRELIVFDNVHYAFDTPWFREFFELFLPAIPETAHAIFISRSKPPFPLWRMRSKQYVNLIEEKIFAFDESETAELFKRNGFPEKLAPVAHQNCFGKVSQMLRFAEAAADE